MKLETRPEQRPEQVNHQRYHEIASHCVTAEDDHRPMVTRECELWGDPCPHYFWAAGVYAQ